MGDPKNPRKAWKKPKRPLNYELKMEELKTLGTYGLKTKQELWKAHTELSRIRHQARSLLALRQEVREKEEPILMQSLSKVGLVEVNATLDDVLNLQVNDLLSRRLQTVALKKFSFKTPYQARQAVVHGHIMIGDRKVSVPSYVVGMIEEKDVHLTPDSSLIQLLEQQEKAKAEEPTTESPEAETVGEVKAQTPKESSPAEEAKVETPAESSPAEEAKVETPAESSPAEEAKVETPAGSSPAEEAKVEDSSTKKS